LSFNFLDWGIGISAGIKWIERQAKIYG